MGNVEVGSPAPPEAVWIVTRVDRRHERIAQCGQRLELSGRQMGLRLHVLLIEKFQVLGFVIIDHWQQVVIEAQVSLLACTTI